MSSIAFIFFIFMLPVYGNCHDYLKSVVDANSSYDFKEIKVSNNRSDTVLSIIGTLPRENIEKSLASIEYSISSSSFYGDEINIDLMFTNSSLRGLGLQKILFEKILERHPNIKRISSDLTSDNEDILQRSLMRVLMLNGHEVKPHRPGNSSEKMFEQCCGDSYMSLPNDLRQKYLLEALRDTPAFKIRDHLGLILCEKDPINVSYSRRAGEFSLIMHISFCRH